MLRDVGTQTLPELQVRVLGGMPCDTIALVDTQRMAELQARGLAGETLLRALLQEHFAVVAVNVGDALQTEQTPHTSV